MTKTCPFFFLGCFYWVITNKLKRIITIALYNWTRIPNKLSIFKYRLTIFKIWNKDFMYEKFKLDVWKRPNCTGNKGTETPGKDLESFPFKEVYWSKFYYMLVIVFDLIKKVYRLIGLNLSLYFIFVH